MSGWLPLLLIFAVALGLLWLMKLRGGVLGLTASALLFGASGYAPPSLEGARHSFFGTFTPAEHWLILADSYACSGDTMSEVEALQAAIRAHPDDPELWVGLGNAFVDHVRTLTPAARFAFYRAIELAPDSPAPRFFLGLALVRSGDREGALAEWQRILAKAPPKASWRPLVENGVELLKQ